MKTTITATQKLEYKVPSVLASIPTVNGHQIPLEQLSEDAINDLYDTMKENAIEYRRSKIVIPDKKLSAAEAGKKLSEKIG